MIDQFIKNNYSFISFDQKKDNIDGPNIIVRHDVDIDPRYAYELAKIEHLKGVRTTYFFALRSPFYNVLSKSNVRHVLEIHQMGHSIGAHIDFAMYGEQTDNAIYEVDILQHYFPFLNTNIVSLHHPGNFDQIKLLSKHSSVANVYSEILNKETAYMSDSTGRWKYGHPLETDAFKTSKSIQLLTHPIWWVAKGKTPKEKINSWIVDHRNTITEDAGYYLPSLSL